MSSKPSKTKPSRAAAGSPKPARKAAPQHEAHMTEETIVQLPLDIIHDSPTQPRRLYSDAEIAEMAASMIPPAGRVHQPIVVRSHPTLPGEFERIFGHKRSRAARLAGLATIPAVVREMDDQAARVAQLVENLQRSAVDPLDEADALAGLREFDGASIEDLMAHVGKGRSYVYNRLRLAAAHDDVRQALYEGDIDAELGVELARLPKPLQPQALERVRHMSFRAAAAELRGSFQFRLSSAPFDVSDPKLVDNEGSCDGCPRRSDADTTLQAECGTNVCLDVTCYRAKTDAARAREAQRRREQEERDRAAANGDAPAATEHQAAGGDAADEADAGIGAPPLSAAERALRLPLYNQVLAALLPAVHRAPRSVHDLRYLLRRELELGDGALHEPTIQLMGWSNEFDTAENLAELSAAKIDAASADDLARMLMLETIYNDALHTTAAARERAALCQHYGIDPVQASGAAADGDARPTAGDKPKAGAAGKTVKYRCPSTGATWSGKGLQPAWLKAALAQGRTLEEMAA